MGRLVVGCDPSSKKLSFFALQLGTDTAKLRTYTFAGKARYEPKHSEEAMTACEEFLEYIEGMTGRRDTRYLFLEEPVMGRGGARTTMIQSFSSGVIQACFVRAGFTVYLINNSTWKAWLGVAGKKTVSHKPKVHIEIAMKQRFPKTAMMVGADGDLLDAAALARYGAETVQRGQLVAQARYLPDE